MSVIKSLFFFNGYFVALSGGKILIFWDMAKVFQTRNYQQGHQCQLLFLDAIFLLVLFFGFFLILDSFGGSDWIECRLGSNSRVILCLCLSRCHFIFFWLSPVLTSRFHCFTSVLAAQVWSEEMLERTCKYLFLLLNFRMYLLFLILFVHARGIMGGKIQNL